MKKEELFTSLDNMLNNPKAKGFLNHLIRSYIPDTNVTKVMEKPTGEFKCVLSGDELFSAEEVLIGMETEEFKANLFEHLKSMFDVKADKETPVSKMIGDKKFGITGTKTTTFMSYPTYQMFLEWVMLKSLNHDKHINWLLGSIRGFKSREGNNNNNNNNDKPKGSATFALGDLGVLQKIKENLEKNE